MTILARLKALRSDPGQGRLNAIMAVAEAWSSIDGKLEQFRDESDPGGYRSGYVVEAEELVKRVEERGFVLRPRKVGANNLGSGAA